MATHQGNQGNQIRALIIVGLLMIFSCPCGAASFPRYTIIDLGTLGGKISIAYGVNKQGAVAGKSEILEGYVKAFYWDPWGMVEIGLGKALGLNDLGRVVGNIHHHNDDAFIWDAMVVGAQDRIIGLEGKAYLWRDGSRIDLNQTIPSDSGWELREARGITDDGTICGNGLINGEIHACLLTPVPWVMVDIKANGSDLPITVSRTDIVSITVTVE